MSCLSQISHTKHVFDKRSPPTTMNAPASSKLFYCSNVWVNTSKSNISELQSIQNFAARIATSTHKYEHITPVLKQLKWLPVATQLYFRNAITRGVLPYKSDGVARRKISRTPLTGTNSTTTNYITGTANFNSNKDNF